MEDTNTRIFEGIVNQIVFKNNANGYKIIRIDTNDDEEITAVGIMPTVALGEGVKIKGNLKIHEKFGEQIEVLEYKNFLPKTSQAILQYLSSSNIKGIGKSIAKSIVDAFGEQALEIIKNEPEKLEIIKGISPKKAKAISDEFHNISSLNDIMISLSKYNITPNGSVKIWEEFGIDSVETIKQNPYIICNEPLNLSFERAELIAKSLEYNLDNTSRICAGICHIINFNQKSIGHMCLPKSKLIKTTEQFLNLEDEKVVDVLMKMIEDGSLICYSKNGEDYIFTKDSYECETYIADRINMMLRYPPKSIVGINDVIKSIETTQNINYANLQKEAIKTALDKGILILTGGPGTGKTTTLNAIINILNNNGETVFLAAPTGRAAKRMSDLCGKEAKTLHRLLEVDFSKNNEHVFLRNENNLLKCDAIIVDELSMVDSYIFLALLKAMPLGCRLILVGDSNQLPSIGGGNVLYDLINSNALPVVELTEIFRQAMKSLIVTNAHKIVKGDMPDLSVRNNDFFFIKQNEPQNICNLIVDLCSKRLPNHYKLSPFDIQILCASKKGIIGTYNLNKHLQNFINPESINKNEITINNVNFREGDKVMQVKNNYDIQWEKDDGNLGTGIFNGDVGKLIEINRDTNTLAIRYDDRVAIYTMEYAIDLELAYAITIHKSQGNEFDAVILPVCNEPDQLAYRNILYTAVTRAKKLIVVVGKENSIVKMVNNDRKTKRYTGLSWFLTGEQVGE